MKFCNTIVGRQTLATEIALSLMEPSCVRQSLFLFLSLCFYLCLLFLHLCFRFCLCVFVFVFVFSFLSLSLCLFWRKTCLIEIFVFLVDCGARQSVVV